MQRPVPSALLLGVGCSKEDSGYDAGHQGIGERRGAKHGEEPAFGDKQEHWVGHWEQGDFVPGGQGSV